MQCKDVEFVVEQEGLAPLPEAARAHVAACSHCQLNRRQSERSTDHER